MAEIKKWEISTLNLLMGREDQLACEADYLKSVAEHIDSCLRQMTNHNSGQDSRISRLGKIIDLARSVARETAKLSTDIVYVTGRDISPLFRAEEMIDVANPYEEPDRKRRVAAVISPLILRLNCNKDGSEGSVILSKARVFLAPL